jgi:hypothetical protein
MKITKETKETKETIDDEISKMMSNQYEKLTNNIKIVFNDEEISKIISLVNTQIKTETNFFEIKNYNYDESASDESDKDENNNTDMSNNFHFYADKNIKLSLFGLMLAVVRFVIEGKNEKAIDIVQSLSNNSLKSMLFLEIFMNIVYNSTNIVLPKICMNIFENVKNIDSNYLKYFRKRIITDSNLTQNDLQKIEHLYYKFLSYNESEDDEISDDLAIFEILIGKIDRAFVHAKKEVTKLKVCMRSTPVNIQDAIVFFFQIMEYPRKLQSNEHKYFLQMF